MTWRPAGEVAQLLADRAGGLAADAGVDLVEHQRRRAGLGRHAHQREHHARELAARRGLAQRAGGHAGVRGDQELDVVAARSARSRRARVTRASKLAPSMASAGEALDDRAGERAGGLLARGAQLRRACAASSARAASSAASPASSASSAPASSSRRRRHSSA